MPNYQETQLSGTSYQRCRLVEIRNPYLQTPTVTFSEARINNVGDRVLREEPSAPIHIGYDPATVIQSYDPETLEPVEGADFTMGEVYAMLFSAYIHFAKARDAMVEPPSPAP